MKLTAFHSCNKEVYNLQLTALEDKIMTITTWDYFLISKQISVRPMVIPHKPQKPRLNSTTFFTFS